MTVENAIDVTNAPELPAEPVDIVTEPTAAAPAEPVENADQAPAPAPENTDANAAEDAKQKGFQKRIDRLTREKYEAKARADLLEQMITQTQRPAEGNKQAEGRPTQSQYANTEDYLEALTDWKLEQREQASKAQETQRAQQSEQQKIDKLLSAAEALGDFDVEDFTASVKITNPMKEAILDSDIGAKLIHHLNAHPDESVRIANLSPARQAAEIGKLEVTLSAPKPAPKPSKAPPPIEPIGSGNAAVDSLETDDMDKYIAMRKKQGARWAR